MGKNSKMHKRAMEEAEKKRKSDPSYKPEVYDIDIYAEYESIGGIIWRPVEKDPLGDKNKSDNTQ
jgi:glucan biosynthesis protein